MKTCKTEDCKTELGREITASRIICWCDFILVLILSVHAYFFLL